MSLQDLRISGEDKLQRKYILPKKVLWAGEGVTNANKLLGPAATYVYVGKPEVTRLSSEQGKKAAILLDFGSELAGGIQLVVSGGISNKSGVKLRICFGESVSEAMSRVPQKHATNDHAVREMSVLLTGWSQPTFGNTGYRFVYLELEEEQAWVDLQAVQAVLTYRDIPYLGSFECDDALLNKIYEVCAYTVHLNMQNMLWDGVKRDRLVWIGDIYPEMKTICSVFGDHEIVDDCLRFVPATNQIPGWPNNFTTYGLWYLFILWDWYWYNGRAELVFELKEYWLALLKQLLELVHTDREEILDESELQRGFFLDWPTYGTEEAKAGVYALYCMTLLASSKLCGLVGESELEKQCLDYAQLLQSRNWNHNERKQVVAMMEMADMIEKEEAGLALSKDGGRGMSTFMSYFILSATAEAADMCTAQNMLSEYYGAMLDAGATTFWEDFDLDWVQKGASIEKILEPGEYDIHGDNGKFCYQGFRHSLCHGWSAGPAAFLAEQVLGIRILEAGCKKIAVKPQLGNLKWAKGTYPTPYGIIRIELRQENDIVTCNIDAPSEVEIVKIGVS